jgi:hypothetical protein
VTFGLPLTLPNERTVRTSADEIRVFAFFLNCEVYACGSLISVNKGNHIFPFVPLPDLRVHRSLLPPCEIAALSQTPT